MRLLHRTRAHEPTVEMDEAPVAARAPEAPPPQYPSRPAEAVAPPAESETKVRERTTTFAPGQFVSLIAGVFFLAVGLIALIRAGIDGSLSTPVVNVLGWTHTALLGWVELAVGVALILAGISALGRVVSVFVGLLMLIAGIIVLAQVASVPDEFGIERSYGWPVTVIGALVALAALVVPVWRTRERRETVDVGR